MQPEIRCEVNGRKTKPKLKTMYCYKRTEFSPDCLYTVGYYAPDGKWYPESDHDNSEEAAKRVHYLNGGK